CRVIRDILFNRYIGAMERYHARFIPLFDKRKQVHPRMAEVNVHEIGATPFQERSQELIFSPVNNGRTPLHEFKPSVTQKIHALLWNNFDIRKRETFCVLQLLGHDKGLDPPQPFYLPIDVQHLRLEKARAITCYNSLGHKEVLSLS